MKKNKNKKRTLNLRTVGRQVLRTLDGDDLQKVSGGAPEYGHKISRACDGGGGGTIVVTSSCGIG